MPEPLPKRLVCVEWLDTYYDEGVHSEDDLLNEDKTCRMFTVGFLVGSENDPEAVTVGMEWSPYGNHYRHVSRIRRENIQKIVMIAEPKVRKPRKPKEAPIVNQG